MREKWKRKERFDYKMIREQTWLQKDEYNKMDLTGYSDNLWTVLIWLVATCGQGN